MTEKQKPLILVCNDDGIFAPGIAALISVVQELGDIIVVAPDSPQSGMGHAITINDSLRLNHFKDVDYPKYSCSGTPVDCIKMAVSALAPRKIDLVVSGINHGSNSSINVIYSGTMSAAVEGCIEGIPSVGFSLCDHSFNADFEPAKPYIRKIVQQILDNGLPEGVCLNVNFPRAAAKNIKGIKVARQANAYWKEKMEERTDPRGGKYYWLTGTFKNLDNGKDTDEWALKNNYVSIVPVQIDLTAYKMLSTLNSWDFSIE